MATVPNAANVRAGQRARPRPQDPNFCLYHTAVASHAVCADCKNGFCQDCLVQFQGQPLCAPCKNQRVKGLHKASPTSQLALASLLLALFTGPLAFCLYPLGAQLFHATAQRLGPAAAIHRPRVWHLGPDGHGKNPSARWEIVGRVRNPDGLFRRVLDAVPDFLRRPVNGNLSRL